MSGFAGSDEKMGKSPVHRAGCEKEGRVSWLNF
jgi:hypothetical protein